MEEESKVFKNEAEMIKNEYISLKNETNTYKNEAENLIEDLQMENCKQTELIVK